MIGLIRLTADDLRSAFQLLSRIPVGLSAGGARSTRGLRFAPLVGAAIALIQALLMIPLLALHLPALAVAGMGLAVSLGLTGALHEDGLADVADGFGGGAGRERKLAIMRDSRIGTYGAAALACSLLIRAACLAALAIGGPATLGAGLVFAATLSRSLMLVPVALLRPARADGLGATVTDGARANFAWSLAIAAVLCAAAALWAPFPVERLAIAVVVGAAASGAMTALAHRQIGGMTGDVAGAAQQVAELGLLLALSGG